MSALNIVSSFSRLSLQNSVKSSLRSISTTSTIYFKPTASLFAEPLKKKKKLDPAIVKAREDRKKKKLEKAIRKLEKSARTFKPIEECEVPLVLLDEKPKRERHLQPPSAAVVEKKIALEKHWALYKREQHLADIQLIDKLQYSQQRALDELKNESEELYQEAIQFDFFLLPYKSEGPVETPPIENYDVPDGDYQDVSKKWQ